FRRPPQSPLFPSTTLFRSDSISRSINYYYYDLAYEMGIDRFAQFMRRYGFGEPTGVELVGENTGVVPSREWKLGRSSEPWYPGEDRKSTRLNSSHVKISYA